MTPLFKPASLPLIRRYVPDFQGTAYVHTLQAHLVGRIFWRLFAEQTRPDSVVVDLGCGSGTTVLQAAEQVATAIGVDVNEQPFQKHPELTIVEGDASSDVHRRRGGFLIKSDLTSVPLSSRIADLVTSRWVFEHLEDPDKALKEVHRLLKPGGVALIIVPNRLHPGIFLTSLLPLSTKQRLLSAFGQVDEDFVLRTYYRINTESALDRHFADAGFERLEVNYVRDPSYWLFSTVLFQLAVAVGRVTKRMPLLRRFQMHMIGLYRKR